MAITEESNNDFHIEKCDYSKLVLNEIFYWTFPAL